MEKIVQYLATSSALWSAVIIGVAAALEQAGVISTATREWIATVGLPYIMFRIAGDGAKAAKAAMKK